MNHRTGIVLQCQRIAIRIAQIKSARTIPRDDDISPSLDEGVILADDSLGGNCQLLVSAGYQTPTGQVDGVVSDIY